MIFKTLTGKGFSSVIAGQPVWPVQVTRTLAAEARVLAAAAMGLQSTAVRRLSRC